MKISWTLDTMEQVIEKELLPVIKKAKIITLRGPLGVGKTTITKQILAVLGVKEVVVSPTFGYVNSYESNAGTLYHFDLYRLNAEDEFIAAGFDEYLVDPEAKVFVEWPSVIEPLLEKISEDLSIVHLVLSYDRDTPEVRILRLSK
jgi:tRNA threonylcarbamoyladenosine biosynthesis protein TsaE